jgi:hypothetical protein
MQRFLASNSLAILSLIAIKNSQPESREGQGSPIVILSRGPWLALAGLENPARTTNLLVVILIIKEECPE